MNAGGGFPAAESFAWHHDLIARREADYDPRVLGRIRRGERQTARDLIVLARAAVCASRTSGAGSRASTRSSAPRCRSSRRRSVALDDDDEYARANLLMLRNPTVVNLLDGCAISVPMHDEGEPPMGLMVAGLADEDAEAAARRRLDRGADCDRARADARTAARRRSTIDTAIVAGWTGRDRAAVRSTSPSSRRSASRALRARRSSTACRRSRLTTAPEIESTAASSGEVEAVLLRHDGRLWVGVGSDHTDREVEAYGVAVSKQMCDKPIAADFWRYEDVQRRTGTG